MKIKSIAAICKKRQSITLYQRENEYGEVKQYISDGSAVYPAVGLPYLTEESILTIFDVPGKQRDKWIVNRAEFPGALNLDDIDENEIQVGESDISIEHGGTTMKPLFLRNGIAYIDSRYLAPLKDVMDVLQLYERRTASGTTYIAAKAGFMLQAIIMPLAVSQAFADDLLHVAQKTDEKVKKEGLNEG